MKMKNYIYLQKNKMKQFIFLLTIIFLIGCDKKNQLKEGDILFQDLNCGELCDAIESVTDGVKGKDFSHCALVVEINDSLKVIEAIGNQVKTTSIHDFFARSGDTNAINNITIARLKPEFQKNIPAAVDFSKAQIGQPYDDFFLLNNGKWYCSELLYEAFVTASKDTNFFALSPMTFKNPATNDFFPAWIEYYKTLNAAIPEGELGLNPGSISRSSKLEIINSKNLKIN